MIFWILQFRAQLLRPLGLGENDEPKTKAAKVVDLKAVDTDADGLKDYDEINVYKTSPYLEDTDSDGLSDKQEVEQGTSPTCPQGKNCGAMEQIKVGTSTQTNLLPATSLPTLDIPLDTNDLGFDQNALQGVLSGVADAATLRQLLISSGVNQAELNQISDADLLKSYQETLKKQNNQ